MGFLLFFVCKGSWLCAVYCPGKALEAARLFYVVCYEICRMLHILIEMPKRKIMSARQRRKRHKSGLDLSYRKDGGNEA